MARVLLSTFACLLLSSISVAGAADTLSIKLLSGEELQLQKVRDKPIYLKFWATWCGKCRAQMPHREAIHRTYGDELNVVAVNFGFNDTPELVRQFQKEYDLAVPIALDELGNIARAFDVTVVPYSIIIDRDGIIVHRKFGDEGVDEIIAGLLEQHRQ